MKKLIIIYITLKDIGLYRLILRLRSELRRLIDKLLCPYFALKLIGINNNFPLWKDLKILERNYLERFHNKQINNDNYILFEFINQEKKIKLPIIWNNKEWERLWQFHLHYFDWLRDWIETSLSKKVWTKETKIINYMIDDWIEKNPPGKGDGWHSYTISLRIRNLIYVYRFFPEFISRKRIESIWIQLNWLEHHKEKFHGGNHYLENLISLIIGSLQFDGRDSKNIYNKNLLILKEELNKQILFDGGHEERSASYHILILDRLIELGIILNIAKGIRPRWLISTIKRMKKWLISITLNNNNFPRFNDSPIDGCPNIKIVNDFANSYLYFIKFEHGGIRLLLIKSLMLFKDSKNIKAYIKNNFQNEKLPQITNLKHTGWTILRPDNKWELLFKCGKSCPLHLPAHVHSDQLSFDLFYKGIPIFAEAGTSKYGVNKIRSYERKYSAHNIIQFSKDTNNKTNKLNWIEPVEVWSSFRAGKKARGTNQRSGINKKLGLWVQGSHDAYENLGIEHKRSIGIKVLNKDVILFSLKDTIKNESLLFWRLWIHLGPSVKREIMSDTIKIFKEKRLTCTWIKTCYSEGFNKRTIRDSLCIEGFFKKGVHELKIDLAINPYIYQV